MRKQLLSILTATAMTLSAVPFTVLAETKEIPDSTEVSDEITTIVAQGKCGDATWSLDSNGTLIISEAGMGDGITQNINKNYNNPTSLFIDYSSLITNVIVNEGITWIDMGLFKDLTELQSVILPESLKIIQPYAFQNCKKLTEINIPENVYVIKNDVFTNTAWFNSKLEESPLVIVNDIVIDGKKCKGDVEIPYGVTAISESAFEKCSDITSVKIPETVTKIPYLAFADCTSLKSVELSNGIKELGKLCFYSCTSLETINIPDSVEFIDTYALINCLSLKEIEIHENTSLEEQSIGSYYEEKHLHKISDFTIKGYNNSHAQVYAKYNGFNFVALDEKTETIKGDANCSVTV